MQYLSGSFEVEKAGLTFAHPKKCSNRRVASSNAEYIHSVDVAGFAERVLIRAILHADGLASLILIGMWATNTKQNFRSVKSGRMNYGWRQIRVSLCLMVASELIREFQKKHDFDDLRLMDSDQHSWPLCETMVTCFVALWIRTENLLLHQTISRFCKCVAHTREINVSSCDSCEQLLPFSKNIWIECYAVPEWCLSS